MNSNYGRGSSGSLKNFDFDLGLGSGRTKSLNDQKNQTTSSFSSYSSTTSAAESKPAWQPNKPSWTHQPATSLANPSGLSGPTSMVGDIFGKSWAPTGSSAGNSSGIGIVNKSANLFGDLVSSGLGQGKRNTNSNVPLKNATPTSNSSSKSPYSMGNLADALPKTSGNWGTSGGYNSGSASSNINNSKNQNLGGPSMKSTAGVAGGVGGGSGIGSKKDPFGSLVDFSSKPSGSLNARSSKGDKAKAPDDAFGNFRNATTPSSTFQSNGFGSSNNDFMGSNMASGLNMDDFGMPAKNIESQSQPSVQSSGGDPLDMLFSSYSASGVATQGVATQESGGDGVQQSSGVDDWGLDMEFGGAGAIDEGDSTTELEGLPPPPAGVTAAVAKSKGVDNQKQGQYADAIKWLSWAVILHEKADDKAGRMEVLSCRASCYKEVGEYKKAVADCSKVLEHDDRNVSVLVQRALLYESMEKYKLGAEDLRTVLKIDPGNRIARSTVHRLAKMAD